MRSGVFQPVTFLSTTTKSKPVLDEGGFQQLLAAAYVLQQHNDSLQAKNPRLDAAWIFAQISEAETLVRHGSLNLPQAARLVGEQLCNMTGAISASVCLLGDEHVECVAETGVAARNPGSSIAAAAVAAEERLKNGRQFQSLEAQSDSRLDTALCAELGVRSLLAVPIQSAEQTLGLIELRWGLANAIHECDVRTCRIMANLVAEVLGRSDSSTSIEQASWHQESLAGSDAQTALATPELHPHPAESGGTTHVESAEELATECRVCGRPFSGDEAFCGQCSMPRVAASADSDNLQSKWASMWFMQQAQETRKETNLDRRATAGKFLLPAPPVPKSPTRAVLNPVDLPIQKFPSPQPLPPARPAAVSDSAARSHDTGPQTFTVDQYQVSAEPYEAAQMVPEHASPSREYDPVSGGNPGAQPSPSLLSRLRPLLSLRVRISRRTVTVALFSVVGFFLLAAWVSWQPRSRTQLSWFESLLVDLGLAEVQTRPAPVYAGNPNVRVWEDIHTALYYCPDSDLYGKTPSGRFSTQRAAQEDQFESATRIACQ